MEQDQDKIHVRLGDRDFTLHEIFSVEVGVAHQIEKWQKFIKPTLALAVLIGAGGFLTGTEGFVASGGLLAAAFAAKLSVTESMDAGRY